METFVRRRQALNQTINRMGRTEWALMLLLSLLWGGAFFLGKVAVDALPPLTVVAVRVSLAAVMLNAVLLVTGRRLPQGRGLWVRFMVLGLLNNALPFSLIFWGETRISSGLASILNASSPAWCILLAHFLTRDEKLTPNKALGVVLGLLGAVTLIGWDILVGERGNAVAQLAVVGAAVSYGLAGIYSKQFNAVPPLVLSTAQLTCAAVWMIPAALLTYPAGVPFAPDLKVVLALLGLALFCSALAYILYFRILATAGASNALLVTLLVPVSANALSVAFLGERIGVSQVVGMALIGLGLLRIDGRVVERATRRVRAR